mmetsp:Transcript_16055/g.41276  ORF Transcript_16055/g.41276 Transcript_16055/m.41276 type:complete len:182 (-) Transcript_16055:110-655(-)
MVNWAVPGSTDADREKRREFELEFQEFHTGSGYYKHKFDDDIHSFPDNHRLQIQEVREWVRQTRGHDSRISWFMVNAPRSPFFLEITRPLLSIRITGSMVCELNAKYLKRYIIHPMRSGAEDGRSEMYLRVGLNLNFLQDAKDSVRNGSKELTKFVLSFVLISLEFLYLLCSRSISTGSNY